MKAAEKNQPEVAAAVVAWRQLQETINQRWQQWW